MINVLDIETYEEDNKVIPYCISLSINNEIFTVYNKKNMIIEILNIIYEKTNNNVEIYVHNLNFDGMIIIDEITKNKIYYNVCCIKTNIYYIEILYMKLKIKFRCSYKILPLSLRDIGERENFKKKYFPYTFVNKNTLNYIGKIPDKKYWKDNDYENFISESNDTIFDLKKNVIDYCENDVLLTKRFLLKIIAIINEEDHDILKKSYSSASISHKLFFKKYNFFKIKEKINKTEENYIRNSFFGGRCEVYGNPFSEKEIVKYFDYSGMYGLCMNECFHNGCGEYSLNADYNEPGFHTIEYISENMLIPILPTKLNEKLIFCNGKNIGTFWFEEIKLFVEYGGIIVRVLNSYIYKKFEKVFENFVNVFTNIRNKGGYYKTFGKLMINSLYGSMALKTDDEFTYITFSEIEFKEIIEKMDINYFYKINETYLISIIINYKSKFFSKQIKYNQNLSLRNVSYSSAIASKARIKLYYAFKNIEKDGGRILYCDTDSIFAAYDKNDNREYWNENKWLDFYEDCVFINPKAYALKKKNESEIKIKGINNKNIDFYTLKKNFYDEENLIFDNQLNFRRKDFLLKQFYTNKKFAITSYDKRTFILNKKFTIPPFKYE